MDGRTPIVAIPACRKMIAPHQFHAVGEKYINAVATAARAMPLVVPALGGALPIRSLLGRIDGLMLTGSPSNVEPHHYGGPRSREGTLHDPHRDVTSLALIRTAVAAGLPVLAICRGLQEVNVALGGTLHQNVHEIDGMLDHRERPDSGPDVGYGPAHAVRLTPGGLLQRLHGDAAAEVNSLHAQAVDRLADGVVVEATASDGLIEAFRLDDPAQYLLAVQWHPEWQVLDNPFYHAIFESFGDACREFAARDTHGRHHELV